MADEQEKEVIDNINNGSTGSTAGALSELFGKMAEGADTGADDKEKAKDDQAASDDKKNTDDAFGSGGDAPPTDDAEKAKSDDRGDEGQKDGEKKADNKPDGDKADDKSSDDQKATDKKPDDQKAADDEDLSDITDEDLAPHPMDKPKTQRRIKALLKRVQEATEATATTKKELEEKATKLADLEKKLSAEGGDAAGKLGDDVQKQLEELAMYRRQHELDSDPSVKEKFDSVIEQREADIEGILKRNDAGDALIKLIKDEGGLAKFSRSTKAYKLADGKSMSAAQIFQKIRNVIEDVNPADAIELTSALQDQSRLASEKKRYIEAEKGKAVGYFEERRKAQEEYQKGIKTKVDGWVQKVTNEDSDFKPLPVPADASPEKVQEIQEENKYRKQLSEVLKSSLAIKDPDEYLEMVLDAAKAYPLRREVERSKKVIASKDSEIASLKAELEKVRASGSTITKRDGSLGGPRGQEPAKQQPAPKGIEDAFEEVARGNG